MRSAANTALAQTVQDLTTLNADDGDGLYETTVAAGPDSVMVIGVRGTDGERQGLRYGIRRNVAGLWDVD